MQIIVLRDTAFVICHKTKQKKTVCDNKIFLVLGPYNAAWHFPWPVSVCVGGSGGAGYKSLQFYVVFQV